MSKNEPVRPLPKNLIQVGIPIAHPIYDSDGILLMQAGTIVTTESQLEKLYERGLYLNLKSVEAIKRQNLDSTASEKNNPDPEQTDSENLVDLSLKSIAIGELLQISPLSDDTKTIKYFVKYLGGLDKKSIICTLPEVDEKVVFIKLHSGLQVQLFSGKDVYKFTTSVDAVFSTPYPHMHIKFPKIVYGKNLRRNQRVSVSIISSLINRTPGEFVNLKSAGRIVDLSLGGAMIDASKIIGTQHDDLECSFKINQDGYEVILAIPCVLRSIAEATNDSGAIIYKHGVQFKEIAFQDKAVLQNYIFHIFNRKKN
jgi:c-di-GMP-binding flagellar brake protein YcgR